MLIIHKRKQEIKNLCITLFENDYCKDCGKCNYRIYDLIKQKKVIIKFKKYREKVHPQSNVYKFRKSLVEISEGAFIPFDAKLALLEYGDYYNVQIKCKESNKSINYKNDDSFVS